MGGDSAGSNDAFNLMIRKDPKVGIVEDYIIGFTSSFRMGQILLNAWEPPSWDKESQPDLYKFMVKDFIDALRKLFADSGYLRKENEVQSGGTFLVGCHGRLFTIFNDFQVAESLDNYASVGCGFDIALGSMFTSSGYGNPQERVSVALEAAGTFSAGVRGPFTILTLEKKND
jgi:hypothetical protein